MNGGDNLEISNSTPCADYCCTVPADKSPPPLLYAVLVGVLDAIRLRRKQTKQSGTAAQAPTSTPIRPSGKR